MFGMGQRTDRGHRRDWWRRQIEEQQAGNLSVAQFCRRFNLCTSTFYAWRRRLEEPGRAPQAPRPARDTRQPIPPDALPVRFLPVSIREAAPAVQLEIALANACVVRLQGAVDSDLLATAIRAAGQLGGPPQGAR
jgi:transposase-like protein